MIEMQDKLEKVREFIQANPGKSNRWYADNNGFIKKTTFYKYLNVIVMDTLDGQTDTQTDNESASASTSEIIENIFEEHEKNENKKSKNRQYNYNTRSRKALVEELQKENEELKEKIYQYEDWIERLQEFIDMPEDVRKGEIEKMRADQKFKTYLADSNFFKMLSLFSL